VLYREVIPGLREHADWGARFLGADHSLTAHAKAALATCGNGGITMTKKLAVTGAAVVAVIAVGFAASGVPTRPTVQELGKVVDEVEALDAMRSNLAASFAGEPDRSTFAQVCKPVGARAKKMAQENGWEFVQMSEKYRNPAHKPDEEAELALRAFEDDGRLMGMWMRTEMDGQAGIRYFRRIVVERSCLACHGPKDERPQFVKDGYPDDRAYGFEVGDLRGVYSVFVAE
jgi:hypothetical protein